MSRLPPLLGSTGIDFGYKPAINIVLPRKKIPRLLPDEDDFIEEEFEDTIGISSEDSYDVVVDCPFPLTVLWASFEFNTGYTVQLGWGGQGEGVSYMDFDGDGPEVVAGPTNDPHYPTPEINVPELGYLQINTGDPDPGEPDAQNLHYIIHYRRPA